MVACCGPVSTINRVCVSSCVHTSRYCYSSRMGDRTDHPGILTTNPCHTYNTCSKLTTPSPYKQLMAIVFGPIINIKYF